MKRAMKKWGLLLGLGLALAGMAVFLSACGDRSGHTPESAAPAATVAPEATAVPAAAVPAATSATAAQTMCPVTGEAIDQSNFVDYQGRRVYFCCPECKDKFNADPAKYLAVLDGQRAAPTSGMAGMTGNTQTPAQSGSSRGSATPATTAVKYTCPMHPEVITDAPGRCPKCGMNLVPKR